MIFDAKMISTLKIGLDRSYFGTHTPLCAESFVSPLTKTRIIIPQEKERERKRDARVETVGALFEDDS